MTGDPAGSESAGGDAALRLPSPALVVLCGPSGAGKSTWAAANLTVPALSSDALRALVGEGTTDQRASADAFTLVDAAVEARARRRLTTVVDTMGYDAERRAAWRELARRHGLTSVAVIFTTPAAEIRRRNRARSDRLPDAVVARQLRAWPGIEAAIRAEPFDLVVEAGGGPVTLVPQALAAPARPPHPVTSAPAAHGAEGGSGDGGTLRFGLQLSSFTWPGGPAEVRGRLGEIAAAAEAAGFASIWVMDHFRQIPQVGPEWADLLESWATLAYLAAVTERVRLGTLVSGITYRNVGHLAKIVATLDVLSGGRAVCGLGAAWFEKEHRAYGWPFPPLRERYALLEDALQVLPMLWGKGQPPFEGAVLRFSDTLCYPRPLQARVPLLVGGQGERRTLRLAARYGDACNLFGEPATVAHKVAVLHRHCHDLGRDPAAVEVTHLGTALVGVDPAHVEQLVAAGKPRRVSAERYATAVNAGTASEHIARYRALQGAGVRHAIVSLADLNGPEAVARFAAVIAAFA
jgi:F420-dependent oxidoreductase-like protein